MGFLVLCINQSECKM